MKKSYILIFLLLFLLINTASAACPSGGCPGSCPTCPGSSQSNTGSCPTCGHSTPSIPDIRPVEPIKPENRDYVHPEYIKYVDDLYNETKNNPDGYIIVDVRPPEKYNEGHIPNAINIPWYTLKDLSKAAEVLGNHGVSNGKKIVVYSDTCKECGGMGVAAYVFWLFHYLGYKDVSLLDGGYDAWKKLYNITKEPYTLPKAKFNAKINQEIFADVKWVEEHLNDPNVQIVDARTKDEYDAGHIPNAINIDYNSLMRGEGRLEDSKVLGFLFRAKGLDKDKEILVYCKGGVRSSYMYFALSAMGYKVRNYVGSWMDWIKYHPVPKIEISDYGLSANKVYKGMYVNVFAKVRYVEPIRASFCPACGSDLVNIPAMISRPSVYTVKAYVKYGGETKSVSLMSDNDGDGVYKGKIYTTALKPGRYTVEIVASKGNLKSSVVAGILEVLIDNEPPKLQKVEISPKNVGFGQRIKILAEIQDPSRVTAFAIIKSDGKEVAKILLAKKNGMYVGYWYVMVRQGNYSIDIVATDSNGNSATFEDVEELYISGMRHLRSTSFYIIR